MQTIVLFLKKIDYFLKTVEFSKTNLMFIEKN